MKAGLYIKNSVPLREAKEFIVGEEYFCEEGHCYRYVGDDDFEFVRQSPLLYGQRLVDIEKPEVLRLFWVLSPKM